MKKPSISLNAVKSRWLITGVAGFIGSNLLNYLLKNDQYVVGLDNFSTGFEDNLEEVKKTVTKTQWSNFDFYQGDIRDLEVCNKCCRDVEYVLHQAALGSVPRSIENPRDTNDVNVVGFLNMLLASKDQRVKKMVYASSSSVFGDHPSMPKVEGREGNLLSPYAVSKYVNELYAGVFALNYNLPLIGLRYFNVFGPRQNPYGPYAAVIPKWVEKIASGIKIEIYGDGNNSRDFCYVDNVVVANILAAKSKNPSALNQAYNVAVGQRTRLKDLYRSMSDLFLKEFNIIACKPDFLEPRQGDVLHSHADISKAESLLGYCPVVRVDEGLQKYIRWAFNQKVTKK